MQRQPALCCRRAANTKLRFRRRSAQRLPWEPVTSWGVKMVVGIAQLQRHSATRLACFFCFSLDCSCIQLKSNVVFSKFLLFYLFSVIFFYQLVYFSFFSTPFLCPFITSPFRFCKPSTCDLFQRLKVTQVVRNTTMQRRQLVQIGRNRRCWQARARSIYSWTYRLRYAKEEIKME